MPIEHIVKSDTAVEKYIDEYCFIKELYSSKDHWSHSIALARVLPGVTTKLHKLIETEEKYYIINGAGEMSINGQVSGMVEKGDFVIIPAGASQQIKNTGDEDLIFMCICTPAFQESNYQAIEV